MTKFSSTAQNLAAAALKIAAVNHYMVGFHAATTADVSFDDFSDAHTILVETENKSKDSGSPRFDRAFMVLDFECYARHRTHLGR